MSLGPSTPLPGIIIADRFTKPLQPGTGPRKLKPEYCQADRDENHRRTRRDYHNHADEQDRATDGSDDQAARDLVGNVNGIHTARPALIQSHSRAQCDLIAYVLIHYP